MALISTIPGTGQIDTACHSIQGSETQKAVAIIEARTGSDTSQAERAAVCLRLRAVGNKANQRTLFLTHRLGDAKPKRANDRMCFA